jgi:hypothetical protein
MSLEPHLSVKPKEVQIFRLPPRHCRRPAGKSFSLMAGQARRLGQAAQPLHVRNQLASNAGSTAGRAAVL